MRRPALSPLLGLAKPSLEDERSRYVIYAGVSPEGFGFNTAEALVHHLMGSIKPTGQPACKFFSEARQLTRVIVHVQGESDHKQTGLPGVHEIRDRVPIGLTLLRF